MQMVRKGVCFGMSVLSAVAREEPVLQASATSRVWDLQKFWTKNVQVEDDGKDLGL